MVISQEDKGFAEYLGKFMSEGEQDSKKLAFYYQKTRHHRTIRADGAWAGLTPQLEVQFALFMDLRPMPDYTLNEIVGDGLGKELERVERSGVLREVQATVTMTVENAEEFIKLLAQMIAQAKHTREQIDRVNAAKENAEEATH